MLYSTGVIPPTISPDTVYVSVTDGGSKTGGARRLLSSDAENSSQPADSSDNEGDDWGGAGSLFVNAMQQAEGADANERLDGKSYPANKEGQFSSRRLLQSSDLQIKVSIYSQSQDVMSNVTSAINVSVLQNTGFVVLALPTSYVNPYQVHAIERCCLQHQEE